MRASNTCMPITEDTATIFVAIELSQRQWLAVVHSPERDRVSRYRLDGGDHNGLVALIEKMRARAARILGAMPDVASCYEAGYDGFWLHRRLTAAGITNLVFDPASIAVEQRGRRAKTDRIDGEVMLRTLMAHWRGEPRVVRIVKVPSAEHEDVRRGSRERQRLVTEQTAHINRIKGLLKLIGLGAGNVRRPDWPGWLAAQRDWQGKPLPAHLMAELNREHARLLLVGEQLQEVAAAAADMAAQPASPAVAQTTKRKAQLLRLKSLGPIFAGTLTDELFYKDFRNRREVAAYCGLAPTPWRSGAMDREQGISKAGNRRVRHKAIELAWLWLRHQPGSALSAWFQRVTRSGGRRGKRIAIVGLARKLIVALWRYLTTGLIPEGAIIKA
jgi:transposase